MILSTSSPTALLLLIYKRYSINKKHVHRSNPQQPPAYLIWSNPFRFIVMYCSTGIDRINIFPTVCVCRVGSSEVFQKPRFFS